MKMRRITGHEEIKIIKAALFDLDGTLIDSRNSFLGALNACLN
jgi:phosphoglycolate phosphatase-like HAD superfamily hydrolase